MANRKYRVIITEEASNMLGEHLAFLANVSISAAKVLRADLIAKIKNLEKEPRLHPVFYSNDFKTEYRKLVFKRYLILYSIDETEKTVCVKFVWDSRKDNSLDIESMNPE